VPRRLGARRKMVDPPTGDSWDLGPGGRQTGVSRSAAGIRAQPLTQRRELETKGPRLGEGRGWSGRNRRMGSTSPKRSPGRRTQRAPVNEAPGSIAKHLGVFRPERLEACVR